MSSDPERQRLLALIAAEPSPTRAQGRRRSSIVLGLAVVTMLVIFQAAGGTSHSAPRPLAFTLGIVVGALVIAVVASYGVFRRSRGMGGPPRALLATIAGIVPVATLAWLTSWSGRYTEPFHRVGWRCLALTIALGCALLTAFVVVRRRTIATTPTASGMAFGAVAGAWAAVGVDLWCPLTNAAHASVGHAAPLVLLIALGAWVGRTLLTVRA